MKLDEIHQLFVFYGLKKYESISTSSTSYWVLDSDPSERTINFVRYNHVPAKRLTFVVGKHDDDDVRIADKDISHDALCKTVEQWIERVHT